MPSRKVLIVLIITLLSLSTCLAQQSAKKMTNQDVVDLLSLGVSDDVVIDKIHAAPATDFDTSIDGFKALKAAKVSDAVIRAMINPHPAPAVVTTSAKEAAAKADPNDPNSPHRPGIYMYTKGKNGLQLTMLEPTVYSQGKSGGMFKSAMTYGIAKVKWKAVVKGSHANIKTSDPSAVFYFYTEEATANAGNGSFGGSISPNEFTLLRFEEKKDSRETVVMQGNMFGASAGTDQKANTGFTATKLNSGVYRLVPDKSLSAGEYCFLSSAGIGTIGVGSAGASRLFDFSVVPAE
jgi:hypothetical protein